MKIFTNKEERLETIRGTEKGKWIKVIGEKSVIRQRQCTKRVIMSLKLIFQNIETEDHFVKIKKDYFTDKEKKKKSASRKNSHLLGKFAASAQHSHILTGLLNFKCSNNSSGVQASKAKICSGREWGWGENV